MASFDTQSCRVVRIYETEEKGVDSFHNDHWRNEDGTYGFLLRTPGLSYCRWFPVEEKIEVARLIDDPSHPATSLAYGCGYTCGSSVYVPHLGWLDGETGRTRPHEHPPRDCGTESHRNKAGGSARYPAGSRVHHVAGRFFAPDRGGDCPPGVLDRWSSLVPSGRLTADVLSNEPITLLRGGNPK